MNTGLCVLVQVTGLEPVPKVPVFILDMPFYFIRGKNVARISNKNIFSDMKNSPEESTPGL